MQIDKPTKLEYAMKCIEKKKLNSTEKRLLQNEINIVKDLHNKNIAKCVDVIETRAHVNIIMEKVGGGELYEFLRKKMYFTGIKRN